MKIKVVKSLSDKLLGLLKKSNPRYLLFKTRFGIHTFLLDEPIDVIVLDKDKKVVKIRENLLPNRVFFWNIRFDTVLELPAGSIKRGSIKLDKKINFS